MRFDFLLGEAISHDVSLCQLSPQIVVLNHEATKSSAPFDLDSLVVPHLLAAHAWLMGGMACRSTTV